MTILLDKLLNCSVSLCSCFEISEISVFAYDILIKMAYLSLNEWKLVLNFSTQDDVFVHVGCWMSLSLSGSVGFCLSGTDQYVLLGSF